MKQYLDASVCSCGKAHNVPIDDVLIGKGVVDKLPEYICKLGAKKPFLLADVNTFAAAGKKISQLLDDARIPFSQYVFPQKQLEPDEKVVGAAAMHYDNSCDLIIGIG